MEAASIPEPAGPRITPRRSPLGVITDNILWGPMGLARLIFFVRDPQQTFDDVKTGLSNGTIWALIALGYTLVYGIIELNDSAHAEVFTLAPFVALSIWQTFGID